MSKTTGARKDRHSSKAKNAGSLTPETNEPLLIAYRASWWTPMQLVPAAAARSWMDATGAHFANRCPLSPVRLLARSDSRVEFERRDGNRRFVADWGGAFDGDPGHPLQP